MIDAAELAFMRAHAERWPIAASFHTPTILSLIDALEKAHADLEAESTTIVKQVVAIVRTEAERDYARTLLRKLLEETDGRPLWHVADFVARDKLRASIDAELGKGQ